MARVGIRMTRGRWLLMGGIALVVISVAWLVTRGGDRGAADGAPSASVLAASDAASPLATSPADTTPSPIVTPDPTPTATATPTATPTPTADPTPVASPTDPPLARGDARKLYAAFLVRVNDDRATVDRLNRALTDAASAQDTDGVHDAAVDILDFTDTERDWLREHPPAACYARAHKAARTMVSAYGTTAERALDWSATGGGLAGLAQLKAALDAADAAGEALTAFGRALETTSCA
jgi:hypothetical protein